MKKLGRWAPCTFLFLALSAAVGAEAETYMGGDFAADLAQLVTQKADYTPEQAAAYLVSVGIELGDLESRLDEALLAAAFDRLGLDLVVSDPGRIVGGDEAGRLFQMLDRQDAVFTGELFMVCKPIGGSPFPISCLTDADCLQGGHCQLIQSIKCKGGSLDGVGCMSDGDCPGGVCQIPPGQAKKLTISSPDD